MERRWFLKGLVATAALGSAVGSKAMASAACGQSIPDFWQISMSHSDMPHTFTDAYRLHSDGMLEYAGWSDQRQVIEVADPVRLSDSGQESFRALVNRRFDGTGNTDIAGRPASGIEVSAFAGGKTVHSAASGDVEEAVEFVASLKSKLPARAPGAGIYVWTKPISFSPLVDLDLGQDDCSGDVARAVVEGLTGPRLLAPVKGGGAERYLSGDLSARMEFVAKLTSGYAAFGVLRA